MLGGAVAVTARLRLPAVVAALPVIEPAADVLLSPVMARVGGPSSVAVDWVPACAATVRLEDFDADALLAAIEARRSACFEETVEAWERALLSGV